MKKQIALAVIIPRLRNKFTPRESISMRILCAVLGVYGKQKLKQTGKPREELGERRGRYMAKGGVSDGGLRSVMMTNLRKLGGHYQPIETGLIATGVLDFNYCINGKAGWVECKRTAAWAVKIRKEQCGWADQRVRNGGRVYLAVRRLKEGAFDELWLCRHTAFRKLISGTKLKDLSPIDIEGIWHDGPGAWDWPTISKALQI